MTTTEHKNLMNDYVRIISEENKKIQSRIKSWERNHCDRLVVVSIDFVYAVCDKGGCCSAEVIGGIDRAARIPSKRACEITNEFYAENGYGKIEWCTMYVHEYLRKLLAQNQSTLRFIQQHSK